MQRQSMAGRGAALLLLSAIAIAIAALSTAAADATAATTYLNRRSFPQGFVFGTASSAYQYEGAWNKSGKGLSIWDTFAHTPGKIADGSNGDVAIDHYHRYKEDIDIMESIGFDGFRLSISWPRILPTGKLSGGINMEGVQHYNDVIDALLFKGIKPFVTLFHWDLPQALEDEYQGFLDPKLVKDYTDYAEVCFKMFGDRVKHWITFNEPWTFCTYGYGLGILAPGRSSAPGTEPYTACHNLLLAHASATGLYKEKYQRLQRGKIGITLNSVWYKPYTVGHANDVDAQQRALDFSLGWFMEPITTGQYPATMRMIVGKRLPAFAAQESMMLKGSCDFVGFNYYTTYYAQSVPPSNAPPNWFFDSQADTGGVREGVPIGPQAVNGSWLYIYPPGIKDVLLYAKQRYDNPVIYITENGVDQLNNKSQPIEEALKDEVRVKFYSDHLHYLLEAIRSGVRVKGYFAWTLLDDFEWNGGFTSRLGINFVDFSNGLKRIEKDSAKWFRNFLKK